MSLIPELLHVLSCTLQHFMLKTFYCHKESAASPDLNVEYNFLHLLPLKIVNDHGVRAVSYMTVCPQIFDKSWLRNQNNKSVSRNL